MTPERFREIYFTRAHIGDYVFDVADPRHIGRIERIDWSRIATVRWLKTGWLTEVALCELRQATRHDYEDTP